MGASMLAGLAGMIAILGMCCSVLQCVAGVAVRGSVWQCVAVCYRGL